MLELLFPSYCISCNAPETPLCSRCRDQLPGRELHCIICAARNATGIVCSNCKRGEIKLSRVLPALSYEDETVRELISRLKYFHRSDLAPALGLCMARLLASKLAELPETKRPPVVLLPIPLHRRKERLRGYNQAELLAKTVSEETSVPLLQRTALARIVATPSQITMRSRIERLQNMKGAFAVLPGNESQIRGKLIILVDDIATTGATLNEAARELRLNGAREVWGLVAARK